MLRAIDIAWTAGFLEGEGSFTCWGKSATVTASQVQPEPLLRLRHLFGGKLYRYAPQNPKHSPFMRWHLTHRDARGLMMTIYGLMSPKRKDQIQKALVPWRAMGRAQSLRTRCPKGHLYDEANTYINTTTNGRQCKACRRRWANDRNALRRIS